MFSKKDIGIIFLTLASLLLGFSNVYSQEIPSIKIQRPSGSRVYDENSLILTQESKLFNEIADSLFNKLQITISAVITNDIGDQSIASAASDLVSQWNKDDNRSKEILIFIAYKQRKRHIFVSDSLNDLSESLIEKIQHQTIDYSFKQEKYGKGILSFAYEISDTLAKKNLIELGLEKERFYEEDGGNTARMVLFSLFVFFLIVIFKNGGKKGCLLGVITGQSSRNQQKENDYTQGFGGGFGRGNRLSGFNDGFGRSTFGKGSSKN